MFKVWILITTRLKEFLDLNSLASMSLIICHGIYMLTIFVLEPIDNNNNNNNNNNNHFTALFPDHPGEPVPEENFWTLWWKGRLTEADTPNIWMGATPSRLVTSAHLHQPHILYRPDALPAAQPTASKHRRQLAHSD